MLIYKFYVFIIFVYFFSYCLRGRIEMSQAIKFNKEKGTIQHAIYQNSQHLIPTTYKEIFF